VLQCVADNYGYIREERDVPRHEHVAVRVLQCVAVCCSVLQRIAGRL